MATKPAVRKTKRANPKANPSASSSRLSRSKSLRGKELEHAVEQFQSEPNAVKAHERWKQIETSVFGVQFED
jgi:hypothetical protein